MHHRYWLPAMFTSVALLIMSAEYNTVALFLTFDRPAEIFATVEFDLAKGHGLLVEQTLASKAIYIQPGQAGDKLKHDIDRPKIIVEVADTGFAPEFDKLHRAYLRSRLKQDGLSRSEAKQMADSLIIQMRQFKKVRMPPPR